MKRLVSGAFIALLAFLSFTNTSFSSCWVEDGTFYSKSKYDTITFAMAMEQENRQKALEMVDQGRIHSCSSASAIVLERDKGFVHVHISGIGKVWIYETFLKCR